MQTNPPTGNAGSGAIIAEATKVSQQGSRRQFKRSIRLVQAALLQFFVMIIVVGVFGSSHWPDATFRVASGIVMVVGALWTARVLSLGLTVDSDSIIVRNLVRTRLLKTSQVTTFEAPKRYGRLRGNGLRIRMTDGSVVLAKAFTTTPVDGPNNPGLRVTNELNDWLASIRAHEPLEVIAPARRSVTVAWCVFAVTTTFCDLLAVAGLINPSLGN